MRFVRRHAGLLLVIVIFLVFTFWIGSYLTGVNRPQLTDNSQQGESQPVVETTTPPSPTETPSLNWARREFKQFNLSLEVPESWPTVVEQNATGVRFVNPADNKELLGVRLQPANAGSRVRGGYTITKESQKVIAGQAAFLLEASRKADPTPLKLMLVTNFGKLYELYGQQADFDRFSGSLNFVQGELPAVKSYTTTGCNLRVNYPDSWHSREIFGPPGAATITGFDPKPIPETGESSGKIQVSCITGTEAARYRANFEAFHKEVKSEKIPLAQFEALELVGRVPDDAPAAAGQQRLQVVLEREDVSPDGRTYIITYTSAKDSFEQDRKGLTTILETVEFL